MRFTQLVTIGGIGFSLLLTFGNTAFASPLKDYLHAESGAINTCLLTAMEADSNEDNGKPVQSRDISFSKIDACLNSTLPYLENSVEVEAKFENVAFGNHVSMAGTFTFMPLALEDSVVSKEELNDFQAIISPEESSFMFGDDSRDFDIDAESCTLSGVEDFAYAFSTEYGSSLKVQSLLVVASDVASEGHANAATDALITTLISLQDQLAVAEQSSVQLKIDCESEAVSMAIADGLANATVVQVTSPDSYRVSGGYNMPEGYSLPSYSASNEFSFSFGSRKGTFTTNGQTLSVETTRRNNQLQTSYQALPVVIGDEVVRLLSTQRNDAAEVQPSFQNF